MQRNNNFEIPPGYTNEQFQEPITSVRTTTLIVRDHTLLSIHSQNNFKAAKFPKVGKIMVFRLRAYNEL